MVLLTVNQAEKVIPYMREQVKMAVIADLKEWFFK